MWTGEQKNTKRQQTPFDDQPSTSRLRSSERDVEFSQGKYTQNPAVINLAHAFGNLHFTDQSNIHQPSIEPMRRISTQSHTSIASFQSPHLQNHQNSHGNYVDIDAIDSILSENENFHHFSGAPQYERNVANENRIQSVMDVAIGSPIYENSLINRAESPIYSNTHNQSVASLYSKSQNIYSNLPAITAGPPNAAAYANIQPPQPSETKENISPAFVNLFSS